MFSLQNIKSTQGSTKPIPLVLQTRLFKGLIEIGLEQIKMDAMRACAKGSLRENRKTLHLSVRDIKITWY